LAEYYDRYLVPLNFAPNAEVVADRTKGFHPQRVLETAAGTGIVTEALARTLPSSVTITATDLNQQMIERLRRERLQKKRKRLTQVKEIQARQGL
jgi:ubiquinone/menaquinone biosynthesis C-methylase UbiE